MLVLLVPLVRKFVFYRFGKDVISLLWVGKEGVRTSIVQIKCASREGCAIECLKLFEPWRR